jgi:hypothetical protein
VAVATLVVMARVHLTVALITDVDKLTMHDTYLGQDQIHATNGSGININHIGSSIIPTSCHDLILKNVLHVPSTHKHLMPIHRFTFDNDTFIEFHPYSFMIKDRKNEKSVVAQTM